MKNALTTINVLEDATLVGGTAVSLSMIQTILGITIMAFQIVLILIKCGKKLYHAIKNKNVSEVEDALNETKGELENLKEKTDGKH